MIYQVPGNSTAMPPQCVWLSVIEGAVVLLLAFVLLNYGAAALKWYRLTPALRRRYNRLPKGSLGWPLLGETLALQHSLMSTSPHTFVTDRRRRYGSSIFLTHLFGIPLLASTDSDTNKLILTKDDQFTTTLPKSIKMAVGENAILLMHGERHKRLRRMVSTLFSPEALKHHAPYILEVACSSLQTWKGRTVIVADEARDFTFFVVLRLVLGMSRDQRSERFHDKFMELRNGTRALPVDFPGTSYRKAIQARKALKEIVEEFIVERKKSVANETQFSDLLGKLVRAEEDGGENLTNDEIVDVVLSTMLAGVDTSSNTLLFLVYFIGQHPNLHHDLKVEHEQILREKGPNDVTWSDYKKMKLTQFAINETLRLANPAMSLHRKAKEDFEYNGNVIPAGSQVQVWLRTIHTDPNIYPQPYNFDINRWKGKAITNNFFPFGVGPRLCVGMEVARLELSFFIHRLVTTYSWEMAEIDGPKFFPEPGMKKGLPILVTEL